MVRDRDRRAGRVRCIDVATDGSGEGAPHGTAFRGHSDVLVFIVEPRRANVGVSNGDDSDNQLGWKEMIQVDPMGKSFVC